MLDYFKPKWFVWENVPGVLSSGGGRDFGSFLGAVVKLGYGFSYRVLDAQYFGVAQRRRRVFVVGHLGDWRPAASVLFERHSLCGHPAPSREKGKEVAGTIAARFGISRNNHEECVAARMVAFGEYSIDGTASSMKARDYKDATDLVTQPIPIHDQATRHAGKNGEKTMGKGNGLGIGQPGSPMNTLTKGDRHAVAQPIAFQLNGDRSNPGVSVSEGKAFCLPANPMSDRGQAVAQPIPLNTMTMQGRPSDDGRMGSGIGKPGDPCPTLTKGHSHAVAQPIAFQQNTRDEVRYINGDGSIVGALAASAGMKQTNYVFAPAEVGPCMGASGPPYSRTGNERVESEALAIHNMAVRRLTPVECERLQGFPDDYTNIPWRGKPESPDGPRYKSLGNSMAVPVMEWIGKRVNQYERMEEETNHDYYS
jgi:DNA (cytosine-5)-methyltransferase 1